MVPHITEVFTEKYSIVSTFIARFVSRDFSIGVQVQNYWTLFQAKPAAVPSTRLTLSAKPGFGLFLFILRRFFCCCFFFSNVASPVEKHVSCLAKARTVDRLRLSLLSVFRFCRTLASLEHIGLSLGSALPQSRRLCIEFFKRKQAELARRFSAKCVLFNVCRAPLTCMTTYVSTSVYMYTY